MSTAQPIDVRDMAIVHRTFRNVYEESARLVRAAPTPSPARVTFLADHIDFGIAALHHHHEDEDELLYPKLIERVPEQAAMTEHVEHEHQLIKTALEEASAACAAWRERPSAETGEALAAALAGGVLCLAGVALSRRGPPRDPHRFDNRSSPGAGRLQ